MAEGKKFDEGKTRLELLPPSLLEGIGKVLTFGAKKYEDRNWERGIKWSRCYGALLRHMTAWWGGQDLDPETGYSHLWHAGCCLAFLIEYEQTHRELDDRPDTPQSAQEMHAYELARYNAIGGIPPNRLHSLGGLADATGIPD